MKIKFYQFLDKFLRIGKRANSITYEEALTMMKNDKNIVLVDVRSPQEYKEGHLEGAINIPLYDIEEQSTKKLKNPEIPIIVYCQSGGRSRKATEILEKQGFTSVYNIQGGLDDR